MATPETPVASQRPAARGTAPVLMEFLARAAGLEEPLLSVARLVADSRALSRRRIAAEAGVSRSKVDLAAGELRLLFSAPQQGQLPVRILHEAIRWASSAPARRRYRLPEQRDEADVPWHTSLAHLHRFLARLGLTERERDFAELLVDPDMLNERAIAEILDLSTNQADLVRQLVRVHTGAARRGQVRLVLLHGALAQAAAARHGA